MRQRALRSWKVHGTVDGSEIRQTHQLRLVIFFPIFSRAFIYARCFFLGISEPSTRSPEEFGECFVWSEENQGHFAKS